MIPKSGNRFSEKIMRNAKSQAGADVSLPAAEGIFKPKSA
jgi:hypothetical protein